MHARARLQLKLCLQRKADLIFHGWLMRVIDALPYVNFPQLHAAGAYIILRGVLMPVVFGLI